MSRRHLVFVYGTLKRGFGNNGLLEDSVCLGYACTLKGFTMLNVGNAFPALMLDDSGDPAEGEIYSVDEATLQRLDRLEGCPHHYTRKRVPVQLNDKPWKGTAWVYCYESNRFDYRKVPCDADGILRWI